MLRDIGIIELLLIALVILIIFGGGKLPLIGRFMGRMVRDFREGMNSDVSKETKRSSTAPVRPSASRPESSASLRKAAAPASTAVKPADPRRSQQAMYPLVEEGAPLARSTAPAPTVTIQVSFSPPAKTTLNPSTPGQTLPAQQAVSNGSTSLVTRIKNFFRSFIKSK